MTIEERAKSFAKSRGINYAIGMRIEAYIQGATDQREIDIEKSCKTYCRFCPHQCENYPHDDCQVLIEYKKILEG